MYRATGSATTRIANWVRARTATPIATTMSASARGVREAMAWCTASTAHMKAGYATTSVIRNEDSVIHGRQMLRNATAYDSRTLRVTLRASRNVGMLAELITNALSTCAC